ncbi:ComEC/Rec2 family competence protein [Clostridium peptidivorans]|uniref:ComEC/Rec2 family competence protein n=1 Tax=Clostridium peptidivorans TaxID=100174 RepID=UPI000BE3DE54|nr:ComEC/Rec2 family competence protein [Clostridium peptidivorans]
MKFCKKYNLVILLLISLLLTSCNTGVNTYNNLKDNILKVHFIDVGQGDSILLSFNNHHMLIDSGTLESSDNLIKYLKRNNIKKFDYVLATHPHDDHIGSMKYVIKEFKIENFYAPKIVSEESSFQDMVNYLRIKNLKIKTARNGVIFNLGDMIHCEMLSPIRSTYDNLNNYSAVLKVRYGDISFLFMGDAELESELDILKEKTDVNSTVLKVGHHGSNTSTSELFLKEVSPKIAVISCGKHNMFNHPSKDILKKLIDLDVKIYRTDIDETVVLTTNGKTISKLY